MGHTDDITPAGAGSIVDGDTEQLGARPAPVDWEQAQTYYEGQL